MVSGDLKVKLALTAAGVLAVAGVVYYVGKKGSDAASAAAEAVKAAARAAVQAVNPMSDKNIFYGGVNSIVRAATGDQDATLGTKIYDWANPDPVPAAVPMWTAADQEDADLGLDMRLLDPETPYLNYSRAFRRSVNR